MTDITELAQRMKAAAESDSANGVGLQLNSTELRQRLHAWKKRGDDCRSF